MRISKELKRAQELALNGEVYQVLPTIEKCFEAGDYLSGVTLAEIYGFQRKWRDCFHCAGQYLLHPNSQENPLNLYTECVQLIAASCMEVPELIPLALKLVESALVAAKESMHRIASSNDIEQHFLKQGLDPEQIEQVLNSARIYGLNTHKRYLDELRNFLQSGDYEGIFYRFESSHSNPQFLPDESTVLSDEQVVRLYGMCDGDCRLLLSVHKRYGIPIALPESAILRLAKCYIKGGFEVDAWNALKALVSKWRPPMNTYMVLPSDLITDPTVRGFMTDERIAYVVNTPKG